MNISEQVRSLLLEGRVDDAMLAITEARTEALGITPKQAQLVRAGLAAGRLLDRPPPPARFRLYLVPNPHSSTQNT
jgi:hypothetical protein